MDDADPAGLLTELGLTEYQAEALAGLLTAGRTTAPALSNATGIPKARIYGVLDDLADAGYVRVIPGRPKEYDPRPPAEILERADQNRYREYERYSQTLDDISADFLATFEPIYEAAADELTPTEELFYVVDVGEPSRSETRRLYDNATDELNVVTKSFEYFPEMEPTFQDALDRGVRIRVLFLHPDHLADANRAVQADRVDRLASEYPSVETRFSENSLPLRGTIVDPSMDYETGEAIFLVEEKDVPLSMRQAAVTENGSLVAGMARYFELIWEYETQTDYRG